MSADFEFEFLQERLKAIRVRLARPERLGLPELNSLKAEYDAIAEVLRTMPRR